MICTVRPCASENFEYLKENKNFEHFFLFIATDLLELSTINENCQ